MPSMGPTLVRATNLKNSRDPYARSRYLPPANRVIMFIAYYELEGGKDSISIIKKKTGDVHNAVPVPPSTCHVIPASSICCVHPSGKCQLARIMFLSKNAAVANVQNR
jgi:hypothetical protein